MLEPDERILGIHHITAIAGDPQQNLDFYSGLLGLRLVKMTVNFDDPTTYHLYYGDRTGQPGTILTFFLWPRGPRGRMGTGQLTTTSFSIPENSLEYWAERLKGHGLEIRRPKARFGEQVISFEDPDGLQLELIARGRPSGNAWRESSVPPEHAITGFHSATLSEQAQDRTASLLTETMGFRLPGNEGNRLRFEAGDGGTVGLVDVLVSPNESPGFVSVGTVHHIAWRTSNDEQQVVWRKKIAAVGLNVTPIIDRKYFHSIYFREPGGVLFEIATDPPGFTIDEPVEQLGSELQLPPRLEPMRQELLQVLPPMQLSWIAKNAPRK